MSSKQKIKNALVGIYVDMGPRIGNFLGVSLLMAMGLVVILILLSISSLTVGGFLEFIIVIPIFATFFIPVQIIHRMYHNIVIDIIAVLILSVIIGFGFSKLPIPESNVIQMIIAIVYDAILRVDRVIFVSKKILLI